MLEGYVTVPGHHKDVFRKYFTTIQSEEYVYPYFMQKRDTRHANDYHIYGTMTFDKMREMMTYAKATVDVLNLPFHMAFGTIEGVR